MCMYLSTSKIKGVGWSASALPRLGAEAYVAALIPPPDGRTGNGTDISLSPQARRHNHHDGRWDATHGKFFLFGQRWYWCKQYLVSRPETRRPCLVTHKPATSSRRQPTDRPRTCPCTLLTLSCNDQHPNRALAEALLLPHHCPKPQ